MSLHQVNPFEILKASTLLLLAGLLFSLGSASHPTSLAAYLSFSAIMVLQDIEMFTPCSPTPSARVSSNLRPRTHGTRRFRRVRIGVHVHPAKVLSEARFESGSRLRIQRFTR